MPGDLGSVRYVFEFENGELNNGVQSGHIPVIFDRSTSQDGFVNAVRAAVLNARLEIAAMNLGQGQLEFSGEDDDGVVIGRL